MNTYQSSQFLEERRSFPSRTPAHHSHDHMQYRQGFVTRHQVSGWRFLMRRIASGVALHDTRMLVEPLRSQARSLLMGLVILATIAGGCFVFTLIWPNTVAGNDLVLADRATSALYVRIGDTLHPALNLTSARLIAGRPVDPVMVRSNVLDTFSRGNLIGIPGAPERMVQNPTHDAQWSLCDQHGGDRSGTTLIAGPLTTSGPHAHPLGKNQAILVNSHGQSWLLFRGKRSRIDLNDNAVVEALGIGASSSLSDLYPISDGVFNAIPEGHPLEVPAIDHAGDNPDFDAPFSSPVGSVVSTYSLDSADHHEKARYFVILPDGIEPISTVMAELLRQRDSYGLDHPPVVPTDVIAHLPVSHLLDTSDYPDQPLQIINTTTASVVGVSWRKLEGATSADLYLLTGEILPIAEQDHPVDLVGAHQGTTATRVVITPGYGYLVRGITAENTHPIEFGTPFWISDTGVRYPIAKEGSSNQENTLAMLGLTDPPLDIPEAFLREFAPGPTLSRHDAFVIHDGIEPSQEASAWMSSHEDAAMVFKGETR